MTLAAFAQSYSGDARKIGLGGIGESTTDATKLMGERRSYRSIVLPFGVIQLIRDRKRFNPDNDEFDPVLLLEYAANPMHYTLHRGGRDIAFVRDLVNGKLNRDLNAYRGFVPAKEMVAEGLMAPSAGYTFKFGGSSNERLNGVFVGIGPYISARTAFNVDEKLRNILASNTDVRSPNTSMLITDTSSGQGAIAVTAGYRAHIPLPGDAGVSSAPVRDGIYFTGSYHYLHGLRYDAADMAFRFDTDSSGLLTINPSTTPAAIDHLYSNSGRGFALDLAMGVVADRWEFGLGANGLANRIEWDNVHREAWTLSSLLAGLDFGKRVLPVLDTKTKVELPVDYITSVAFEPANWSASAEFAHGFRGNNFRAGLERRFGRIELRGGARFSRDRWHPTGGAGLNFTRRFSVDVAAFDTTTNAEQERKASFAVSLRLNRLSDFQ